MPRTVACGRVRRIRGLAGAITGAGTVKVEQAVSGSQRRHSVGETARLGPSHLGGPPAERAGGGVSGGLIRR